MEVNTSRRKLLAGTAALAAAGCALPARALSVKKESDIAWDREADVVILGFGNAGANAAIEAADAGASVIILSSPT